MNTILLSTAIYIFALAILNDMSLRLVLARTQKFPLIRILLCSTIVVVTSFAVSTLISEIAVSMKIQVSAGIIYAASFIAYLIVGSLTYSALLIDSTGNKVSPKKSIGLSLLTVAWSVSLVVAFHVATFCVVLVSKMVA